MLKFEYRGLDMMDQIVSVPIAFDEKHSVLHIKDEWYVVWPDFNGQNGYRHSDGFLQMVKKLKEPYLFQAYAHLNEEAWLEAFTFYFYKDTMVVLFKGNEFLEKIPFNSIKGGDLLVFPEWMA